MKRLLDRLCNVRLRCNPSLLLPTALLVAACGAGSTTTIESADVPTGPPTALEVDRTLVVPGEVLRFELSLRGIVGGEAVVVTGAPAAVDGRQVFAVRSRSESTGVAKMFKEVADDVVSWIEVDSGYPIKLRADTKFGKKEALIESEFNGGKPGPFVVEYKRKGRAQRRYSQLMPSSAAAHDGHSILAALRAWDSKVGSQSFFYVLAGKRLWHNTVAVTEVVRITTKLGRFKARRIEGVAWRLDRRLRRLRHKKERRYTMWVSEDERRLPIMVTAKTEYGEVKVELVGAEVGATVARAR